MSKLMNNRTYISIIVTLLFILVVGLLFVGTPVYAAPLAQTPDITVTFTANPTTVTESEVGVDVVYTLRVENEHAGTIRIIELLQRDDPLAAPPYTSLAGVGTCPDPGATDVLIATGGTFECTFTRTLTSSITVTGAP